jgi:acyl transferase domain-containing protein
MQTEPIAVVGMGCRFPKSPDPDSFWDLIAGGADAITEIPADRWDAETFYNAARRTPGKMCTRWGGFLDDVESFDPLFFKIMPLEAGRIDPQHRLVLEVGWEALESAAIDPLKLAYSATGVFIGVSHCDHNALLYSDRTRIDGYNGPNTYYCFAANRLSHFLNLRGPSMAVDTACSSSLTAIHLACQSLRTGEIDLALAGGVNLNLTPDEFIALSFLGVLSQGNRSKTFDAEADGYVRGEGCGIVVLRRLKDALESRDSILGVIRGSTVNHNGLSNGITAPNGAAQEEVMRRALKSSGVDAAEVSHVEVMGTATALGDPIEMAALKAVYLAGRTASQCCWVTSVKPNIGHLEAASGAASLIKVMLSLKNETIPPHLHCPTPNPSLRLEGTPIAIPLSAQTWPRSGRKRLAAISAFGFGGSNAHLVLEEAPEYIDGAAVAGPQVFTMSAKSESALSELARRYSAFFRRNGSIRLNDVCCTTNTGRANFDYRLAVACENVEQLRSRLESFGATGSAPGLHSGKAVRSAAAVKVDANDASPEQIAHQYVAGHTIDWSGYYASRPARRIQLPTYPFQRRRCSFARAGAGTH